MIFEGGTPSFLNKGPLSESLDRFLQPISTPPLLAEEYADKDDAQRQQKEQQVFTRRSSHPTSA